MIISTTFQNKARVSDGLLLGLPQLIKVQIRGNVEFVQHADHLLTTITLPGMNKTQRTEGVVTPIKHTSENGIIKKNKTNMSLTWTRPPLLVLAERCGSC